MDPNIITALDALSEELDMTNSTIHDLEVRLESISLPPLETGHTSPSPVQSRSEVCSRIINLAEAVRLQRMHLQQIMDGVDLPNHNNITPPRNLDIEKDYTMAHAHVPRR